MESPCCWIVAILWCLVLFSVVVSADEDGSEASYQQSLNVELVADGLVAPLDLTFAPNDGASDRRFIVDQIGLVFILTADDQVLTEEPFLNITDRVVLSSAFDERGLLGFAFHPTDTSKVYASYSAERANTENICLDRNGTIPSSDEPDACPLQHSKRISEFTLSSPDTVDASTERILFSIEWPGRKHNGGGLAFGPDGYLYIGLGDGGWVHGPTGDDSPLDGSISPQLYSADLIAQDMTQYFGKILRIDVDAPSDNDEGDVPYGIPEDNPFVGNETTYPPEIFAWGFRNPFRISFDRNDYSSNNSGSSSSPTYFPFYVSATAETLFESTYKVDGPGNYGWAIKEGTQCIARSQPLVPPFTVNCTDDSDCPSGPQTLFCGSDGSCTCPQVDSVLGAPIHDPIIEYVNLAATEHNESAALVEEGWIDKGLGRASLGGYVYRGSAIPWLYGKFVQGDFAIDLLNGQIFVATQVGQSNQSLCSLEQAYVFNATDPVYSGFVKSIGQDAKGELYAITGAFTPTGLIGRVFQIVDAPNSTTSGDDSNSAMPTVPPSMSPVTSSSTNLRVNTLSVYKFLTVGILAPSFLFG